MLAAIWLGQQQAALPPGRAAGVEGGTGVCCQHYTNVGTLSFLASSHIPTGFALAYIVSSRAAVVAARTVVLPDAAADACPGAMKCRNMLYGVFDVVACAARG
jgi:hypothetical protein